jgi:hypothetical protein
MRRMRILLISPLALALLCAPAHANPGTPDPDRCSVLPPDAMDSPRLLGVPAEGPGGAPVANLDIYVRMSDGTPVEDVLVEVVPATSCNDPDPLCICNDAGLTGYTDEQGYVRLNLKFGGCCQDPYSAFIYAGGFPIRAYSILVSPDYNGARGDCRVSLGDFVYLMGRYGQTGVPCSNLDGDGEDACTLPDFVEFAGAYARVCSGN